MAGLMGRAEQRKALRRAGDADTDPASISASENTSNHDSESANDTTIDNTSSSNSGNTSEKTSRKDSDKAGGKTVKNTGTKSSKKTSTPDRENTSEPASTNTSRRRGPGRPSGPDRRAITVRVLAEHDQILTEAWDEDGLRPQQVIDQALADWAKKRHRQRRKHNS